MQHAFLNDVADTTQLSLVGFDVLPEGFVPKEKETIRRRMRRTSDPMAEAQLSFKHLIEMTEDEAEAFIGGIEWSDDDLGILREGILREAIRVLLDNRASQASRVERWQWIQSDEIAPFSFTVCLNSLSTSEGDFEGSDCESFREKLTYLLRKHKALDCLVNAAA